MNGYDDDDERRLASRIAASASEAEREALRLWIERLLKLKDEPRPVLEKAKLAVSLTTDSSLILPAVKLIASEVKRLAWDERGPNERVAIGGAAVGLALFGWPAVGIAALGAAVGVPLWVVFGSGAKFLEVLGEEITAKRDTKQAGSPSTDR